MADEIAARFRRDLASADSSVRAMAAVYAASCGSCAFRGYGDRTCRAHAPRSKADGTPVWPIVGDDHWCGEWRAL